jgi:hypothetical protein
MNAKILFPLLAAMALLCAGCATETAQQRDQRITRTLQAFELQAQHIVEMNSGKPRKDWGPAETAAYNALFLQALQYWHQAEQEGVARRQAQAAIMANGLQQAGDQIQQGAQHSGYGSGDSGYGSGVILGPNVKTSTYFRNPGGGVILGSDGSITNVIGN